MNAIKSTRIHSALKPLRTTALLLGGLLAATLSVTACEDAKGDDKVTGPVPFPVTATPGPGNECEYTVNVSGYSQNQATGYTVVSTTSGPASFEGTISVVSDTSGGVNSPLRSVGVPGHTTGHRHEQSSAGCSTLGCVEGNYTITLAPNTGFSCGDITVTSLELNMS